MDPLRASVVRVIDGDTISIRTSLRLRGSAPELGTPEGTAAAQALGRKYRRGAKITVDILTIDSYGRILGTITGGGYMYFDLVAASCRGHSLSALRV
jgi:endonuclease YncB( thermonuclease family)